ncbi:serine/threonine protein kinase [Thermosyntropha lipolytica DSM 11003]|uniref:non-specific serine/threonine protein kinase n=1 Tax=Thermosyntropha lipolytica DSM 11003 TaxID=1123382 RepID=A0A1M5R0C6_9FIRM|nr:Stk1 family PASTA domain-containing Ser/Thr kinase [Thermosyntropha lipolytica]SHH19253.1 serine/threonine protein kinase [Thermosyntropha lipolytica DSM 11003]
MTGTVLGGRYELLEKSGEGGMAVVYKAFDKALGRVVAVKILKPEFARDANFVQKFKTEAQAAAKLSHPNIVNIYDVGQDGDVHYIVLEFVEGYTLKELIEKEAPLDIRKAVDITIMVCDGIHHAHERGVIHKDIKPHNILITSSGLVKVADFGIAQAVSKKTITFGGNILGSVQYISPEQAKGEPVTRQTDIYSLGCVLYEMLTGKVPFDAESPITVALKHIHDEPQFPEELADVIPQNLQAIVLKAMAKIPAYRFKTAEEMRNALIGFYNGRRETYSINDDYGKTIIMPPISGERMDYELPKKRKLRPQALVLILAALIGLLAGIFYVLGDGLFGKEVEVPDIVGMESKEAKDTLDKLGLKMVVVREDTSSDMEPGRIVSQNPPAGMKVKKGREIEVVLSKGTAIAKVPNLVGISLSDAEIRLANENLVLGRVEEEYDTKYARGLIISQSPKGGTRVKEGSRVDVLVSKGEPPEKIKMPDLIGLNINDAKKRLEDMGLLVARIVEKESSQYYTDQVIEQDIQPGVMLEKGSSVTLTISKGPGPAAQTKALEIRLPSDQEYYKVVIEVTDVKGKREVYNQINQAGEVLYIGVSYFGSGKADVYLNGKFYKTYSL